MLADISTIIWKESRELFIQRPGFRGGWMGLLIIVGVFGILFPYQSGIEWLSAPTTVLMWAWLPFILVNGVVADSFAGERERHTLETLLASRLSDRSILIGKICSAIAYGWGIALIGMIVGLVTINVSNWAGKILFFPPFIGVTMLSSSFLIAWLAADLGIIVSLKADSVRQAQQTLSVAFLLFFIPLLLLPVLPDNLRISLQNALGNLDFQSVIVALTLILLVFDIGLLVVAFRRFIRPRLVLTEQ
ncbi:MAG: ABC transporter permease [Anaerolineales bacterium]|jgi:ABC-2 type transport system permease protein